MNKNEKIEKMPLYNDLEGTFTNIINSETVFVIEKTFYNPILIPVHWHDNYLEIELITGGGGTEIFNGEEFRQKKGDVTILSYTDFHALNIEKNTSIFKINISYDMLDPEIKSYLTENNNIRFSFEEKDYNYIYALCKKLEKYFHEPQNILSTMAGKAIISTLITETIRQCATHKSVQKKPKQIQTIIQYINQNISSDLTLDNLANHFGTSANYLGKLFKKNIGVPYNEYLNRIRLKLACTMISSSNVSMKEIAHNSGFSSLEYFYYVFKKYNNMTPSQYRENTKK